MIAAVNSKREKYDPLNWMQDGKELKRRAAEERAKRQPLTGEQILDRFSALGVPVIDKRARKAV